MKTKSGIQYTNNTCLTFGGIYIAFQNSVPENQYEIHIQQDDYLYFIKEDMMAFHYFVCSYHLKNMTPTNTNASDSMADPDPITKKSIVL